MLTRGYEFLHIVPADVGHWETQVRSAALWAVLEPSHLHRLYSSSSLDGGDSAQRVNDHFHSLSRSILGSDSASNGMKVTRDPARWNVQLEYDTVLSVIAKSQDTEV